MTAPATTQDGFEIVIAGEVFGAKRFFVLWHTRDGKQYSCCGQYPTHEAAVESMKRLVGLPLRFDSRGNPL